ncbi:MAG TPA: DUF4881 domain-containing protein [Candidatus Atribacteria bacterium]|nr:DUF4881 domain-containing protein [Candidatus Atribacteria bacterium]
MPRGLILLLFLILIIGCEEFGKVDQGRVVAYDKEKGLCTLIRDTSSDPRNPDYSCLPPIIYEVPKKPSEMGPEPKPGLRIKFDTQNRQITIFDPNTQSFKTITYILIDQKENVDKKNSLVFDKEQKKPKKFPLVDRNKKSITIYSKRQKILVTLSLPDEYFKLPDYTWDAGDEVRIYYKEEGKALRLMNISQTDIYKK